MGIYYPKAVVGLDIITHDYGVEGTPEKISTVIVPVRCTVNVNTYTQADTFNVVMRFEDFPFDPRLIRSLHATIAILDLKGLKNIQVKDLRNIRENAVITGFADTHSISLDQTERTITFAGRDYTSVFIDTKFDNAALEDANGKRLRKIDLNKPLVSVLEDVMSNVPSRGEIKIEDRTKGAVPNVRVATAGNYDLVNGKTSTDGNFFYVNQNQTYWDVIVSLCEAVGVICYIELDKMVLNLPRILYQGQTLATKRIVPFIYGNNLMRLDFHRNLSRKKRFNLVLRSWNIRTAQPTEVSIPRDASTEWAKSINVDKSVQMIKELDPSGVPISKPAPAFSFSYYNLNKEELIRIGEKTFEEIIRQQVEGSFETREMRVNDTEGAEFDLTQLRVGTPVQIEITAKDLQYITRKSLEGDNISDGRRKDYLIRRGYRPETAQALIDTVAKSTGKIRPTFYLKEAQIEMGGDGFSVRGDFVNYIHLGTKEGGRIVSG